MPDLSPNLNVAIRVIHGEYDHIDVPSILGDWGLETVIALATDTHPIIRAVAALSSNLTALLDPSIIDHPALHDAVQQCIGTSNGRSVITSLARAAPAGWGRAHTAVLINAVQQGIYDRDAFAIASVASLIGPCDDAAALLTNLLTVEIAIRSWGMSEPSNPTAWTNALSPRERKRMLDIVLSEPSAVARCLPWLPMGMADQAVIDNFPGTALYAFSNASPISHAQHAACIQRLVEQTQATDIRELTHLACATQARAHWDRVQTLLWDSPDEAFSVISVAPWNDLPKTVRDAILSCADRSDVCAAVAAARGWCKLATMELQSICSAFFAALDPGVWDDLDDEMRQRWIDEMNNDDLYLLIRSIGSRLTMLARIKIDNDLVHTVRLHVRDDDALRSTLFPVALRNLSPHEAYEIMTALPTPPDSGAFFCVASGVADPSVIVHAHATLHTPDVIARAVALQRILTGGYDTLDACAMLQHVLQGWTRHDRAMIMPILDVNARTALMPNPNALVKRLTHPDRHNQRHALRAALARLAELPLEIETIVCISLDALGERYGYEQDVRDAAKALATALHAHGELFLSIVDTLDKHLRDALLPSLPDPCQNASLRVLARDNPSIAHQLAHAIQDSSWDEIMDVLPKLPPHHCRNLAPSASHLVNYLGSSVHRETLQAALARLEAFPPEDDAIVRIALKALDSKFIDCRNGAAKAISSVLHAHGDVFVSIVDALKGERRDVALPLPEDAALAEALRDLAYEDPPNAQRLAHALRKKNLHQAVHALLTAPLRRSDAVWQALDAITRCEIIDKNVKACPLAESIFMCDPIAALALAAMHADDVVLQEAGRNALAAHPDLLRAIWMKLTQGKQQFLCEHPSIALCVADLTQTHDRSAERRIRCC